MRFLYLSLLILWTSCLSQEWSAQEAGKKLFDPDKNVFRSFEIGMSRLAFDEAYTGDAIYGNPNEIIDSLLLDEGIYCETAFRFYKNILSEIEVRIELKEEHKKDEIFQFIQSKMEGDYGKGIKEKDYLYWRIEGSIVTTDVFLHSTEKSDKGFVISLYYTVATEVS